MKAIIDDRLFMKQMNNIVAYANGFIDGVQMGKQGLLNKVGLEVKLMLEEYIDVNARMNPQALHHVYEWHQTGQSNARLFEITYIPTGRGITFQSNFSQSRSIKNGSNVPFYNKASIMEAGASVTIAPRNSPVLAFEADGETVFTSQPVTVSNPGGDVKGEYEATVKEFFLKYLSQSFLDVTGLRRHFNSPLAFKHNLAAGAAGGRAVGVKVGRQWVTSKESVI